MSSQRQRLLDEAQWAIEHRQLDRAARVYRQLFEAEPESIQVGLKLGELYLKMEARQAALEVYWALIKANLEGGEAHLRTLLKLVLKLEPARLEAQLMLFEVTCAALQSNEASELDSAQLKRELLLTIEALCELCRHSSPEERLDPLARVLSVPLEQLFGQAPQALNDCRLLYADTCDSLGAHQEGLPYYVWATLDAERRNDPQQLARYGHLAIALDHQLDPSLQRHLRISFARVLLPIASADISLVEQVYFALEPLTQGEPSDDLEAHLLLGHLLRLQGHPLHADALLHQVGAEAHAAQQRALAIVAYESILSAQPNDPIALSALSELHSTEALFREAQGAFSRGQLHHALEFLRSLIEQGASSLAVYQLLIRTADALELAPLQESSRLAVLDWALQHKIELALTPTLELCQRRTNAIIPYLKRYTWLYQAALKELDEPLKQWLGELTSPDVSEARPTLQAHDTLEGEAPSARSARSALGRAHAQWSTESALLEGPFTPAPLNVSAPSSGPAPPALTVQAGGEEVVEGEVEIPSEVVAHVPQRPLVELPPLMAELSASSPQGTSIAPLPPAQALRSIDSSTPRRSRALTLYQEAGERDDTLPTSVLSPPESPPIKRSEGFDSIDDPLSLFDSGASFQGALSSDHPLIAERIRDLFHDEQELVASLEEQLSLIETPTVDDRAEGDDHQVPPHDEVPTSAQEVDVIAHEIGDLISAHRALVHELDHVHSSSPPPLHQAQRLHLGVHPLLPSLAARLTQLKGTPPNPSQLSIISLINAREYELALTHIPTHLKTSSIHYLKALCLYGQGHLEEALELVEITLSRATPQRAEYFYALAAELNHALRRDELVEHNLLELLALDAQLGATVYQALRS